MKLNFKSIIIIFLVAMLGGAAGAYGILELNKANNTAISTTTSSNTPTTEQISYSNNENDYSKVIDKAIKTVVEITTKAEVQSQSFFGGVTTSEATYLGSGVIISEDGYIVTNNHVVESATNVSVSINEGETYEAKIIGTDTKTDLALIKIEATNLPYSKLVDSDQLVLGQEVIAIGNALGNGTSCSNGIVSAINREVTIKNYSMTLIQTNAELNSGNSGGGLFDMHANLVGIVNAKTSSSYFSNEASIEGVGFAIPANTVKAVVKELSDNGYVKDRPSLGVKIYTSQYNEYYGIQGLVVSETIKGSAAEKAGLKPNDIIKAIDGTIVNEFSELAKILDYYKIGDKVTLSVDRDGKLIEIEVVLQESIKN